jgi:PIN domain nuclease of toxin-antitoxin system
LRFLADACALIFFHGRDGETMTAAGREAMEDGDVFVSPITVWEIARKVSVGKLARPTPPNYRLGLSSWLRESGYRSLPLTWDDCESAWVLPAHHKDPMDRILIASALQRDLTIVTKDRMFSNYGVGTVW